MDRSSTGPLRQIGLARAGIDTLGWDERRRRRPWISSNEPSNGSSDSRRPPKPIALGPTHVMTGRLLLEGYAMPWIYTPAVEDVDLAGWVGEHRSRLQ
ncbi:MAG: hypothetical protein MRJ92_08920 [Nitrospira sp.]|nr:hypothetical protein [Nitrospira sp.]